MFVLIEMVTVKNLPATQGTKPTVYSDVDCHLRHVGPDLPSGANVFQIHCPSNHLSIDCRIMHFS